MQTVAREAREMRGSREEYMPQQPEEDMPQQPEDALQIQLDEARANKVISKTKNYNNNSKYKFIISCTNVD